MDLAENCHREAAKTDIAPRLTERDWIAAEQTALGASLARCDAFEQRLREIRTGSRTRTDEEEAARGELLTALDPIIKGARRKYPDRSAERRAYGIGARLSSAPAKTLLDTAIYATSQLAPGPGGTPPKDTLKGVLPAEITTLSQLAASYRTADWAQADAQKTAAELLSQLRQEIETVLNPLRRDLQGAADQAFTHRDPTNAAQRKAFGLQADRSLNSCPARLVVEMPRVAGMVSTDPTHPNHPPPSDERPHRSDKSVERPASCPFFVPLSYRASC